VQIPAPSSRVLSDAHLSPLASSIIYKKIISPISHLLTQSQFYKPVSLLKRSEVLVIGYCMDILRWNWRF
jgi:hypothetical protein